MVSIETIQTARRILGAIRKVRLSDSPTVDVWDRMGLLTVAAGLRDVAAFGFAEKDSKARLAIVQEILTVQGLRCLATRQIKHTTHEPLKDEIGGLFEVFDHIDAESYAQDTGQLLWVFRDPQKEEQIQKAVERRIPSGTVLGYPACCVAHHELVQERQQRAFATAIVAAVGRDPHAVERALREDLSVELPKDLYDGKNIRDTNARFPFVLHIACDGCISSSDSLSAKLNITYRDLARQFDRRFQQLVEQLAAVRVQIDRLIDEAEQKGYRPGELEEPLRTQLNDLFEVQDKIYSRFFDA